jgi:hypothetical protein
MRQGKQVRGPFAGMSAHVWALHLSLYLDPRYWCFGVSSDGYQFSHTIDIGPIRILWERDLDKEFISDPSTVEVPTYKEVVPIVGRCVQVCFNETLKMYPNFPRPKNFGISMSNTYLIVKVDEDKKTFTAVDNTFTFEFSYKDIGPYLKLLDERVSKFAIETFSLRQGDCQ